VKTKDFTNDLVVRIIHVSYRSN